MQMQKEKTVEENLREKFKEDVSDVIFTLIRKENISEEKVFDPTNPFSIYLLSHEYIEKFNIDENDEYILELFPLIESTVWWVCGTIKNSLCKESMSRKCQKGNKVPKLYTFMNDHYLSCNRKYFSNVYFNFVSYVIINSIKNSDIINYVRNFFENEFSNMKFDESSLNKEEPVKEKVDESKKKLYKDICECKKKYRNNERHLDDFFDILMNNLCGIKLDNRYDMPSVSSENILHSFFNDFLDENEIFCLKAIGFPVHISFMIL